MNKDICIVSVGFDGREPYSQYASELERHARKHGYSTMVWKNQYPDGSPTQQEIPYAFKPFAIKAAIDAGFKKIFWMDCKCYIQEDITQIQNALDTLGYWIVYGGGSVGEWCCDSALEPLEINREDAFDISCIAAKHFALNIENDKAKKFYEEYMRLATENDGIAFKGAWTNDNNKASLDSRVNGHRHDQTCASVLLNRLEMTASKNESVDWRDGWKFRDNKIEPLEILFDGYLHGTHICDCDKCKLAWEEVKSGNKEVPSYFLRNSYV